MAQNFELTDDHLKLLYLISKYTRTAKRSFEKDKWIKEFTLRALIYEGIVNNVFNYDYSPMSIEMIGGRRILNISQDAEDDIADLREMKMLDCLRLSSTNYRLTNLYKISQEGMKVEIPTQFKEQIDSLCKCPKCGSLLELEYDPTGKDDPIYIVCKTTDCLFKTISEISEIEDISYSTEPYFPATPILISEEHEESKKEIIEIKFHELIEAQKQLFRNYYHKKLQGIKKKSGKGE